MVDVSNSKNSITIKVGNTNKNNSIFTVESMNKNNSVSATADTAQYWANQSSLSANQSQESAQEAKNYAELANSYVEGFEDVVTNNTNNIITIISDGKTEINTAKQESVSTINTLVNQSIQEYEDIAEGIRQENSESSDLARQWAISEVIVDNIDYSAKYYAKKAKDNSGIFYDELSDEDIDVEILQAEYATKAEVQEGLDTKQEKGDYALKEEIPSLDGYVKNTDIATANSYGLVKVTNSWGIGQNDTAGLYVMGASESQISAKTSSNSPITPNKLDYAVKVGLTTNSLSLTDSEKAFVKNWLGVNESGGGSGEGGGDSNAIYNISLPANYGVKSQQSGLATSKDFFNFNNCNVINLICKLLQTGNIFNGGEILKLQQNANNYVDINVNGYVLSFNLVINGTKLRTVTYGQTDDIWQALIYSHSWVITFDYIQRKFVINTKSTTSAYTSSFVIDMSDWELEQLGDFQIITEIGKVYTPVLGCKFFVLNSYVNTNEYLDTPLTANNYSPFAVSQIGTATEINNLTMDVGGTRLETISSKHIINSYNMATDGYFAMGASAGKEFTAGCIMATRIRFNEITAETKIKAGAGLTHFIVLDDNLCFLQQVKSASDVLIPEVGKWYTLVAYGIKEISYLSKYAYRLVGAGTIEVQGLYVAYPRTANLGSLNWNGDYFTGYIPFKGEKIKFEQISNTNSPPLYEQKIVNGNIQMWNGTVWKQTTS